MSNILKKMMSLGNLSRAASPTYIGSDVDMQNPNAVGVEPIPSFAEEGILDHTTILMQLLPGPAVSFYVGEEQTLITIAKRLLIYHSPVAATLLTTQTVHSGTDILKLPYHDPLALLHICRWMYQEKLGIVDYCTRTGTSTGMQDACTLLCRIFATAYYLDITAVQDLVLDELTASFSAAREAGMTTPVLPSTVMEVWEDDGGEEGVLWTLVLEEMCVAYSRNPLPAWEQYDECFKHIDPFRLAVAKAMTDRIMIGGGLGGDNGVKIESWDAC